MLKYDFLDNNFTVFEGVPTPTTTIKTPLFNLDIDWGYVNPNGAIIANNNLEENSESEPSKLIVNNNDEVEITPHQESNKSSTTVSVKGRPKLAVEFFKSKFMNELNLDEQIATKSAKAIVGNFMLESGDPTLNKTDNIGDLNLGPKRSAYGMGLWRLDRRTALKNFAAKLGKPMSDFETLLEFAWSEILDGQKLYKILEGLINAKDLREATKSFMNTFERPSNDPKINAINTRIKYAESL